MSLRLNLKDFGSLLKHDNYYVFHLIMGFSSNNYKINIDAMSFTSTNQRTTWIGLEFKRSNIVFISDY